MESDNFVFIRVVFIGFQVESFAQLAEGIIESIS